MTGGVVVAIFVMALLATGWTTGRVLRYVLAQQILDLPNARSLHTLPTPRGGGLALAGVVLLAQAAAIAGALLPAGPGLAWMLVAAALGAVGWWDDRRPRSARLRLCVQALLAVMGVAVLWLAGDLPADAGHWLLAGALAIGIVWLVNLYNFMDGSDGIAAVQAIVAGGGGAVIAGTQGQFGAAAVAAAIAGASLGFLRWNWHPARIFLGDVGSYFLGCQFALLGLYTAANGGDPCYWAILLAPFVTDATLTLMRRIVRGERWYAAHRTHAYQLLVRLGLSHGRVAAGLLVLGVAGLWPLAWLCAGRPDQSWPLTLTAYALTATIWAMIVARAKDLLDS